MEGPARVTGEPGSDFGVLVAGVIVDSYMHDLAGRHVALEAVEGSAGTPGAWGAIYIAR